MGIMPTWNSSAHVSEKYVLSSSYFASAFCLLPLLASAPLQHNRVSTQQQPAGSPISPSTALTIATTDSEIGLFGLSDPKAYNFKFRHDVFDFGERTQPALMMYSSTSRALFVYKALHCVLSVPQIILSRGS